MDIQNVVFPYNRILLGCTKSWSNDRCHSRDKPWKYYAKRQKPVTKDHMSYDSIYRKCPEQANPQTERRLEDGRKVDDSYRARVVSLWWWKCSKMTGDSYTNLWKATTLHTLNVWHVIYLNKAIKKKKLSCSLREFTEMLELFCILPTVVVPRLYICVTILRTLYSKKVNFSSCKWKKKITMCLGGIISWDPWSTLVEPGAANQNSCVWAKRTLRS